jgi:hypothetical protein
MFVTVGLQTTFHTKFAGTIINYPHTDFHISSSNGPLVTTVILKAKENVCTVTMLLYLKK